MDRMTRTAVLSPPRLADPADCAVVDPAPALEALHETEELRRARVGRIVRTIELDVIPRLVRAHRTGLAPGAERPLPPRLTARDVDEFVPLVIAADEEPALATVRRLRESGCEVETIYLDLLAPTAQLLGRMWEDDRCSFGDVTIGVGRLQTILRTLSPLFGTEVDYPADGRRVLLLPAPGEQHLFGLAVLAEFFRRAGWDVRGGVADPGFDAAGALRAEWVDVIGLSVACEAHLEGLESWIHRLRRASRNRGVGVMVGGPAIARREALVAALGADATAVDARTATAVAEKLMSARGLRV